MVRYYSKPDKEMMRIGVVYAPPFPNDTTDRNRTSPFASPATSLNSACWAPHSPSPAPTLFDTIVAHELEFFADRLEKAADFNTELEALVKKHDFEHRRIIFNGNNYSEDWVKEPKNADFSNLRTTADALPRFISPESIALFTHHKVFTEEELRSVMRLCWRITAKPFTFEASPCWRDQKSLIPAYSISE